MKIFKNLLFTSFWVMAVVAFLTVSSIPSFAAKPPVSLNEEEEKGRSKPLTLTFQRGSEDVSFFISGDLFEYILTFMSLPEKTRIRPVAKYFLELVDNTISKQNISWNGWYKWYRDCQQATKLCDQYFAAHKSTRPSIVPALTSIDLQSCSAPGWERDCNMNSDQARLCGERLKGTKVGIVNLRKTFGDEGAIGFVKSLVDTKVHTIRLNENNIGDDGATGIAKNLQGTNVHTVSLAENKIGKKGAVGFFTNLSEKIHTVVLSFNQIGNEGAIGFAPLLSSTKNIHTLNLTNNNIGDKGAIAIALMLPQTNIHTLVLSQNAITGEGATWLSASFKSSRVERANLSCNKLDNHGAAIFIEGLKGSPVHTVSLIDNQIDDVGITGLAKYFEYTKLRKVLLWKDTKDQPTIDYRKAFVANYLHIKIGFIDLSSYVEDVVYWEERDDLPNRPQGSD